MQRFNDEIVCQQTFAKKYLHVAQYLTPTVAMIHARQLAVDQYFEAFL